MRSSRTSLVASLPLLTFSAACGSADSSGLLEGSGINTTPPTGGAGGYVVPNTSGGTGGIGGGGTGGTGGVATGGTGSGSTPGSGGFAGGECTTNDVSGCRDVSGAQRCCTSTAQCGALFTSDAGSLPCLETDVPGILDARCPNVDDPFSNDTFAGCCTPDNRCGGMVPDFGCQIDASANAPVACDAPVSGGAGGTSPLPGGTINGLFSASCSMCANMNCQNELADCQADNVCTNTLSCLSTCFSIQCLTCFGNGQTSNASLNALNGCLRDRCGGICPSI